MTNGNGKAYTIYKETERVARVREYGLEGNLLYDLAVCIDKRCVCTEYGKHLGGARPYREWLREVQEVTQ